ncbi:hypothetical protein DFH09DRAFT_1372880 [Mycena vulgaris]|nr:hypothetical protein DFH09DRAFT_1372880 [Mycena vulgaris]
MSTQITSLFADHGRLCKFSVDGVMRRDAAADPKVWDIEPFLAFLGTSITSLDIRHVCQTMLLALASHADEVASYRCLKHLKMDITEGRGTGTADAHRWQAPPLVVADIMLSKSRAGPLDLVDYTILKEVSLGIRRCNAYDFIPAIKLFEGLSPPSRDQR